MDWQTKVFSHDSYKIIKFVTAKVLNTSFYLYLVILAIKDRILHLIDCRIPFFSFIYPIIQKKFFFIRSILVSW